MLVRLHSASIAASLALCLSLAPAFAQSEVQQSRDIFRQARAAHKEKNYAAYLDLMRKADALRPGHPSIMFNLAGAHALNALPAEALALLRRVAGMGLVFDPAADEDFGSLAALPEFKAVLKLFAANKTHVGRSTPALALKERGLVTEGVAFDPVSKAFFVTSAHRRKVVRVDAKGVATDFATEQSGLWSALGVRVDPKRRVLWVTSAAIPQMVGFTPDLRGRSGVFKFDLASGRLLKKYLLPEDGAEHTLGDLVLSPAGHVYTTDSVTPALYRIAQADTLEPVPVDAPFVSPQGLDFSPDGRYLFVADYSTGLLRIDLSTTKTTRLPYPDSGVVMGVDGLYFHRGSLIGIQNGVAPHRVIRASLAPGLDRIDRIEVVEANHPLFDEPTLGVLVGDTLYYVANSQWGSVDEKGTLAPADRLKDPVILKVKI